MAACEKCWSDAYFKSRINGRSQGDNYHDLLKERGNSPCSPKERAGQFWDEDAQCDKRYEWGAFLYNQ